MYQSNQCGWHFPSIFLRILDDQHVLNHRYQTKALGPEKLYMSRGKVLSKRGCFLFREHIEECSKAEGFETFSPQNNLLKS